MRIHVKDIPARGREVALSRDADWALAAATHATDGVVDTLEGRLFVTRKKGSTVEIEAKATASVELVCDRCGGPVHLTLTADEQLVYEPLRSEAAEVEVELGEDDLDVGWYEGGVLDLADVLSELLALAMPFRITCPAGEPCLSVDLPVDQAAVEPAGHPAFAALKNLL